ncbi:MAG: acetoin utilization protein AcuC [Woeseiaceae bacterium]|nr:acetoin utilization protein AcuC [Woeseiaceae bacterium]
MRSLDPIYLGSEIFRQPAFGANHPLSNMRHAAVLDLSKMLGWLDDDDFHEIEPASAEQLQRFHSRAYVRALQYANATGRVDPEVRDRYQIGTFENPLFPGVYDRAAMTVGGSMLAARLANEGRVAFHPSGGTHHGRADRASGFCYLNDPVFAILTLLDLGRRNVLYIDLDAHHGDGVEDAFYSDDRVTTLSIHESERWPYSGSVSRPEENVFNYSVAPGLNDSELEFLIDHAVLPLVDARQPDALVLCCGADCLAGDPLSKMELSNVALWGTVRQLIEFGLPTVVLGGGGYNPWTVTRYWAGMWGMIRGERVPERLPGEAVRFLDAMECDLIDEEDVEYQWLTRLADTPYPGPVREAIRSLVPDAGRHVA